MLCVPVVCLYVSPPQPCSVCLVLREKKETQAQLARLQKDQSQAIVAHSKEVTRRLLSWLGKCAPRTNDSISYDIVRSASKPDVLCLVNHRQNGGGIAPGGRCKYRVVTPLELACQAVYIDFPLFFCDGTSTDCIRFDGTNQQFVPGGLGTPVWTRTMLRDLVSAHADCDSQTCAALEAVF